MVQDYHAIKYTMFRQLLVEAGFVFSKASPQTIKADPAKAILYRRFFLG